jgi:hypothetical protein
MSISTRPLVTLLLLAGGLAAPALAQQAPLFTPGNLVVSVEGCGVYGGTCTSIPNGTGTGTLNSSTGGYGDNQAGPFTLFQFAPNATASATFVNSVVLPQTASGANFPVSGEYGSSSEGSIQLDGTGKYLTLMGYGLNAAAFDASPTTYGAAPSNAFAQTGSLTGQSYTAVPRVVSFIDPYGNVNSSTAIFNVFNTNNPRSAYSLGGTTGNIYVSGQGAGSDATSGVFLVPFGTTTTTPTPITGLDATSKTVSQDTRFVQIYNNTLYVSADTKGGSNAARSFIGTLGTPPATSLFNSSAGPTQIPASNNASSPTSVTSSGKLVITVSEENGINNAIAAANNGGTVNTSPSGYFFANPYTLYIADTGSPKQNSATSLLGDGGLQKWINTKTDGTGTWVLQYTLASGLNLVQNTASNAGNTSGTTGLYALTGVVSGSNVYLYATNYTINDLDKTYLYGITDPLAATTNPGQSFTVLATAPADSNFKGVSFAPSLPAGSATITTSPSGLTFTSTGTGCAPGTYTTPITLAWTPGSSCKLTVAPQTANGTAYVLSQWQDSTTAASDTVTAPTGSAVYSATFTSSFQPIGNLESVINQNATVVQSDPLVVGGWAADPYDGAPLASVKLYVDGNLAAASPSVTVTRPDVVSYFNNPAYANSGYNFSVSAASLSLGSHVATVVAIDSNGRSTTFGPASFTVVGPNLSPVGNLETTVDAVTSSTSVSQGNPLYVGGWVGDPRDGAPVASLKVYVDGTLFGTAAQGISRPDVVSATGNSAYANSGYALNQSAASLALGPHNVTVVATDSYNLSTTFGPRSITVIAAPPVGNLELAVDASTSSSNVSRSDSLFVSGWAADYGDNGAAKSVAVLLDGTQIGTATLGQSRPDVANYFNNPAWSNTGYFFVTPASSLSLGSHTITVIAKDSANLSSTFGPITINVTP